MRKPVHEALRQRITVHYNYEGLNDKEVAAYVLHKIERAGGSKTIVEDAALAAIHSYAQGNPRLIDNLMTDALAFGSQTEKQSIDADTILVAVDNQNLG